MKKYSVWCKIESYMEFTTLAQSRIDAGKNIKKLLGNDVAIKQIWEIKENGRTNKSR